MFLHELKGSSQKTFFLECACLVAMIAGSSKTTAPQIIASNEENDDLIKPYAAFIDQKELDLLTQYIPELYKEENQFLKKEEFAGLLGGIFDLDQSGYKKFLHLSLGRTNSDKAEAYKAVVDNSTAEAYIAHFEDDNIDFENEYNPSSSFPLLYKLFEQISSKHLAQHKNNEQTQQALAQKLVAEGIDLLTLNQDTVQNLILQLPQVKWLVFQSVLEKMAIDRRKLITSWTEKEKKIIIFELIGMGYASGEFEEEERLLVKEIAAYLGIQEEYIEQADEMVQKLYQGYAQAFELVTQA